MENLMNAAPPAEEDGGALFPKHYVLELRAEIVHWRTRAQKAERELARRNIADMPFLSRSRRGVALPPRDDTGAE